MKPLVIYHANCTDGFGAAFAAWRKLGDEAEYLPMEYGKNFLTTYVGGTIDREIYILDFSLPQEQMDWLFQHAKRVVWLDHHKTAFEMWCGGVPSNGIFEATGTCVTGEGYTLLDDNKSGALLAWEYFHPGTEVPMLIRHIDDRDRWQFKLDGSKELHAALNNYKPWSFEQWRGIFLCGLFEKETWRVPEEFYMEGTAILRAHNQNVQAALKQTVGCKITIHTEQYGCTREIGLAANAPAFLASDLGHELANHSGTFGLVWSMAGDGPIHCSLRSNGEYDVSANAKVFGGGGHRNAAGFSTDIDTLVSWLK